jgi:hypothetical protein
MRLGERRRLRVGMVWAGNAVHANDSRRSISLERLSPLLGQRDIELVSLQKELSAADADVLRRYPDVVQIGTELGDFADTAAVVSLLDLVVSVDTSVAHLAGALGRPVWMLVPFGPDFRWMLTREDSPWYPTLRLFRQPRPSDWDSVLHRVIEELNRLAQAQSANPNASGTP